MKIRLLLTGKTDEDYLKTGIHEYEMRVKRYLSFDIIEIPALRNLANLSQGEQMLRESEVIQKQIAAGDIVVLLDEHGKEMRSTEFASFLNKQFLSGCKTLIFIVGGPFGFDPSLKKKSVDYTFPLQDDVFSPDGAAFFHRAALQGHDNSSW